MRLIHYDLISLDAIESITVDQVRSYAAIHGWQPVKSRREDVLVMWHPHRKVSEIALPLSSELLNLLDRRVLCNCSWRRLLIQVVQGLRLLVTNISVGGFACFDGCL